MVCFFAATTFGQQRDLVQVFEQIATLIRDDRLAEAEKELTAVLRLSPNLPVALNLMGSLRAKQGRLLEAETLFLRAVRDDKTFTGARMNLVYLYQLKRAPDKAILQLKEVLAIEPENLDAKVMLGDAYLAKNDLQKAEENYLAALDGKLDNAGALFGLAQISRVKGETREASIYLNRVSTLTADTKSAEFLYKFGLEAMRVGMFDEAKSALERAVELQPKEASYLLAFGIAWLRKGDLFEAEKLFRRLLELQPNNAQGQLHLGYVLLNQKKYAEARPWLEKSARPGAAIPETFYYLGLVAQEQNDDARAIVLFEKAVRQLPSYAHARIALGASYMRLKNYVRARQELETAVKLDPNEPTAHYNLALLYARIKEPARAQEEMKIIEQLKSKGASTGGVVVLPPKSNP
ncbi:MAG TPA: tetratricopeptide repeat protein [Pyrinomonadaceae bacterium]|nr:tetratricopeptide repeat protein [Pyrinomonadaceae bacterium]